MVHNIFNFFKKKCWQTSIHVVVYALWVASQLHRNNTRKWRNWQTRRLQVPVVAIPCGFKSRLPHSSFCKVRARYIFIFFLNAEVAELADAQASGACGSNTVRVQVPPSALFIFCLKKLTEQTASSFFYTLHFIISKPSSNPKQAHPK